MRELGLTVNVSTVLFGASSAGRRRGRLAVVCMGTALVVLSSGYALGATMTFKAGCTEGDRITVAAVGDLLFHKKLQVQAYQKKGTFTRFWKPVEPLLKAADIAYGNLESPTAHGVSRRGRDVRDTGRRYGEVYSAELKPLLFNVHPSVIEELVQSGFDVLSTANNHAFDRGSLGVDRTIENLEKSEMPFTGTRRKGEDDRPWSVVTKAKGFAVAWLACTYAVNVLAKGSDQVLSCYRDKDQVIAEITSRVADRAVDAVILVPHWGAEDSHHVIQRQRALARAALEAGAAAVIGSHPHVVQGWEKHETEAGDEGLIVYSTGNFISNQRQLMQRAGIIALVELVKDNTGRARVSAAGYVPTWVVIDGNVNHRVIVNTGKSGWTRGALQKTNQLLPAGNHLTSGTDWPPVLPKECSAGE